MSKILAKHVSIQSDYLNSHDLLSSRQNGFRANHTVKLLLYNDEEWLDSLHNNEMVGILFVDLCKAFDIVHPLFSYRNWLLVNLVTVPGIGFTAYTFGRTQGVLKVNSSISSKLHAKLLAYLKAQS